MSVISIRIASMGEVAEVYLSVIDCRFWRPISPIFAAAEKFTTTILPSCKRRSMIQEVADAIFELRANRIFDSKISKVGVLGARSHISSEISDCGEISGFPQITQAAQQ